MNSSSNDPFGGDYNDGETVVIPRPGGRKEEIIPVTPPDQNPSNSNVGNRPSWDPVDPGTFYRKNPFLKHGFNILSLTPKLRTSIFTGDVETLRENLTAEIKTFLTHMEKEGIPQRDIDIGKLFLCALVDESVLNTPWGSQCDWKADNLGARFLGGMWAGEEFFSHLATLKNNPNQNLHLLELAFVCISLGFQGKYRRGQNGTRQLHELQQEIYILIENVRGEREHELSPAWQSRPVNNPLVRYVPIWVFSVVACAFLVFVYLGFRYFAVQASEIVYHDLIPIKVGAGKHPAPPYPAPQAQPPPLPTIIPEPVPDKSERFRALLEPEIRRGLVSVEKGPIVRISNAFRSGSERLLPQYGIVLEKLAKNLRSDDEARLEVLGHSDNDPIRFSARFPDNYQLSLARARYVAEKLEGFPGLSGRLTYAGKGQTNPIVANDSETNKAINRRIDIHIR